MHYAAARIVGVQRRVLSRLEVPDGVESQTAFAHRTNDVGVPYAYTLCAIVISSMWMS